MESWQQEIDNDSDSDYQAFSEGQIELERLGRTKKAQVVCNHAYQVVELIGERLFQVCYTRKDCKRRLLVR